MCKRAAMTALHASLLGENITRLLLYYYGAPSSRKAPASPFSRRKKQACQKDPSREVARDFYCLISGFT